MLETAADVDAEDAAAVAAFRRRLAAGEEELAPAAVVDRILDGESRIRVWRDHRGLGGAALGEKAGLAPGRLDAIEGGQGEASVDDLRRIAAALGVTLTTSRAEARAGTRRTVTSKPSPGGTSAT